jgi:hypothetical protein
MSLYQQAVPAVIARQRSPIQRRFRGIVALTLAALAAGCTQPPPVSRLGPDAADASVRTRPVDYHSTLAPYEPRRPVEPAPWGEQPERVAPQPKP